MGGIDYGDGISGLNPDDIESISVLKVMLLLHFMVLVHLTELLLLQQKVEPSIEKVILLKYLQPQIFQQ